MMSNHTFLSLDMNLIPQSTKDNIPTFWDGYFSNDKSRMLIDGYDKNRNLVHPQETLNRWLYFEENKQEIINSILLAAIEYTQEEILLEKINTSSIWYTGTGEGY